MKQTKKNENWFAIWYDKVRKKVRQGIFPVTLEGTIYEVVHCYIDPFSGTPMIGLFCPETNRHEGIPASILYNKNLITFANETEKA